MSTAGEYQEFMGHMAKFAAIYIGAAHEKRKAGEAYELPTDTQFSTIFYGFTEIRETLDALTLTETLVGLAPPRSKSIDKDSYLKFLVGAYLQEVYILEQRLSAYAKKISRLYKKPNLPNLVQRIVYEPMEGIVGTRGTHVHSQRFTDERLNMVSTMALFQRMGHALGEDLEFEYKFAQNEWKKRIKKNNETTREIVDQYCRVLGLVMCKEKEIIFPCPAQTNPQTGRSKNVA